MLPTTSKTHHVGEGDPHVVEVVAGERATKLDVFVERDLQSSGNHLQHSESIVQYFIVVILHVDVTNFLEQVAPAVLLHARHGDVERVLVESSTLHQQQQRCVGVGKLFAARSAPGE